VRDFRSVPRRGVENPLNLSGNVQGRQLQWKAYGFFSAA